MAASKNDKVMDNNLTDEALESSSNRSFLSTVMKPLQQRPEITSLPQSNLLGRLRNFLPQMAEANSNIDPSSSMDPVVLTEEEQSDSGSSSSSDSDSDDVKDNIPTVVMNFDILDFAGQQNKREADAACAGDGEEDDLPLAFRPAKNVQLQEKKVNEMDN
uniref:Uncharacterized protein n=1 Tax=Steinernema glaseri TaxID=37863 RepID=A0A1I8AV42_9BILA